MPDQYRADRRMPRAARTERLPGGRPLQAAPRAADPVLMELARGEGRCQEVVGKITAHRRLHLRPPGRPAARQNQPGIQLAAGELSVMNWLSTGRIPAAPHPIPMLMAESLALNLLFRAVRPRASRHRANGWIHRSRALL